MECNFLGTMEAGVTIQSSNHFLLLDQIFMREILTATRGEDEGQRGGNAGRGAPNFTHSSESSKPPNFQPKFSPSKLTTTDTVIVFRF